MQLISLNKLIGIFEGKANAHPQIKSFGQGVIEDVNTFQPNEQNYPILWIIPQQFELGVQTVKYTIRVLVFDIDDEDDSHRTEIISDATQILTDIIVGFRADNDDSYNLVGNPIAIPFSQKFTNYMSGVRCDLVIETNIMNTTCFIPQ